MEINNLKILLDEMFMYENKHNLDDLLNKRIKKTKDANNKRKEVK